MYTRIIIYMVNYSIRFYKLYESNSTYKPFYVSEGN